MADEEKDKLLDHDADGIQEYDNDLPRWWLYGFYFTIVMSVIYMFYYHVYGGPDWNFLWYGEKSQELEYVAEVEAAEQMKASIPTGPKMEMKLLTDQASLDAGKDRLARTSPIDTGSMDAPLRKSLQTLRRAFLTKE
jgi:cytochrome c oxidase cbb3-type subunit III